MTDLAINKALALAIGWKPEHVLTWDGCVYVDVAPSPGSAGWRVFDYRDWNVIGPIAERYHASPYIDPRTNKWEGYAAGFGINKAKLVWADTPQKAIALAVIQGAKR